MKSKRIPLIADDDSVSPSKELMAWMEHTREQFLKAVPDGDLMIALHLSRTFLILAMRDYGDHIVQPEVGQWGLLHTAEQNILKVIKERNENKPDRN